MASVFTPASMFSKLHSASLRCLRMKHTTVTSRKSLEVFANDEEYQAYLAEKKAKREKRLLKRKPKIEPPDVTAPPPRDAFKKFVPERVLKLKYKKLRDMPGNVLNRMVCDIREAKDRPLRDLCLLNGINLIKEALEAEDFVKNIYFNRMKKLAKFPVDQLHKTHLTHIPDRMLKFLPKHCQKGLFAVSAVQKPKSSERLLKRRRQAERKNALKLLSTTIIIEGMKDSVEIGKVIKYAEELGCLQIMLMNNCADAWTMDALYQGGGAHFQIPILQNLSWEYMDHHKHGDHFFFAHHSEDGLSLKDLTSSNEYENYNKSKRVIDMVKEQSSEGTISKAKETDLVIDSLHCTDTNLLVPNMLLVGDISLEAFHFVAHAKFKKHLVLNTAEDASESVAKRVNCILEAAQKQRQAKELSRLENDDDASESYDDFSESYDDFSESYDDFSESNDDFSESCDDASVGK